MNPFIWSGFYSLIANLCIGIYVYSRQPKSMVNRLFGIFSLQIAFWSVGSFLVNVIDDKVLALNILRVNYLFGIWLPAIYIHFTYALFEKKGKWEWWILRIVYVGAGLISLFSFSSFFIKGLRLIPTFNFYISDPGFVYYVFFFFFAMSMAEVVRYLLIECLSNWSLNDEISKVSFAANLLAIAAGFEYFSRVFQIVSAPPVDDYILIVYVLVIAFAVIKHSFMDVDKLLEIHREKLALIGTVSSSINHEIKNPLFMIREMVKRGEDAQKILPQVERMQKIVERLGEFARPTPETASDEESELKSVIDNALFFASAELKYQNIKTEIQIPNDLAKLKIDKSQLEVIFLNLIINAYHAMPNGGTLTVIVSPAGAKQSLKITISDTGTGIAKDDLKNIFKPFYTTKQKTGTGLGLHIVKTLVEQNSGKISVSSEPKKGTSFKLIFK